MRGKGTILIVEDQQGFRRIYRDLLENEGYEVLEAGDGETGWAMTKSRKPQMVLLDLGLPVLDGFEVLKRIRADADTKAVPVIIFSVLGEQKDIQKGMDLGANDYTVKGFYTPRQILSKIKDLMTKAGPAKGGASFKVKVMDGTEDAPLLWSELGFTSKNKCPQCQGELVLELFPDYVHNEGHWFTAHFLCGKCNKAY